MSAAITKTLSLLLLILIGYLFQRKISSKDQKEGLKTLILSLALPATILIALLQIEFRTDLIIIPMMSLGFNIVMYLMMDKLPLRPLFNIPVNQYRTLVMLIPSLAPGLSCFPFIIEYSGQGPLAMAALADVGNKIFVLVISYTIAMKWFYEVNPGVAESKRSKIKNMFLAMVNEPVNIVIILAIVMLSLGLNYSSFPYAVALTIDRLSIMMTPLILLFIGISIRLSWGQVKAIFSFLFFRSGIAFAISGAVLLFFPVSDLPTLLLIVVFPQSACSFWPYAHMASVGQMENKIGKTSDGTFDLGFAMNVLACSMPFSVILIMIIYASGSFFATPATVLTSGGIFISLAATMVLVSYKSIFTIKSPGISLGREIQPSERTAS